MPTRHEVARVLADVPAMPEGVLVDGGLPADETYRYALADAVLALFDRAPDTAPAEAADELRAAASAALTYAARRLATARPGDIYDDIDPSAPLRDMAHRFKAGELDAALASTPGGSRG